MKRHFGKLQLTAFALMLILPVSANLAVVGKDHALYSHPGHCRPEAVLIVIDVQNGFIRPSTEQVVPKIKDFVDAWTSQGGEVVFTRFINTSGSQYERLIGWKRLQASPETDLVAALGPQAKTVIDKNYYSVFTSERFRKLIRKKGWRTFAISGIATDSCVMKTAMDAFELGYKPIVLSDAVASHGGTDINEAALRILKRNIGTSQVITTSEFLNDICAQ